MSGAINAAGHLSALGGSVLSPGVRAAMDRAGQDFVDMSRLLAGAEARIAEVCEAEAAYVTAGAAAGIAIAVAGCVTRGEPALVSQVPNVGPARRDVVVQAGHLINFGASVAQMVAIGGGIVRPAGTTQDITPSDLDSCFSANTACFLWVQSHHTRGNAALPLGDCLRAARDRSLPVVMDCAAEEDLAGYTSLGADLVIYSGTKAIGAPVSGFIAGKEPHVSWCRAQSRGIARVMKVGKEQVAGLMAALDEYVGADPAVEQTRQHVLLRGLEAAFAGLPGVTMLRIRDEAGRPIERLGLRFGSPDAARALATALQANEPSIFTRPHRLNEGIVQFDPRCLRREDVEVIAEAMRRVWRASESASSG
jgi:D-glucosaminate-6-phosphate ammonia-lyase